MPNTAPVVAIPNGTQSQASSPVLRGHYPKSKGEAEQAAAAIERLSHRASPEWIAQEVVCFLGAHYPIYSGGKAVAKRRAEDWLKRLHPFPDWAITKAFDWWISRENERRQYPPVPGDIEEGAFKEMTHLRAAETKLQLYAKHGDNPPGFITG